MLRQLWPESFSKPDCLPEDFHFAPQIYNKGIGYCQEAIMNGASHETIHAKSTLADLPAVAWVVDAATPTDLVKAEFDRRPNLPGAIVLSEGKLFGVVARDTFFRRLSGPYCRELFLRKPIKSFLTNWPIDLLQLPSNCSIHAAAELALARPHERLL